MHSIKNGCLKTNTKLNSVSDCHEYPVRSTQNLGTCFYRTSKSQNNPLRNSIAAFNSICHSLQAYLKRKSEDWFDCFWIYIYTALQKLGNSFSNFLTNQTYIIFWNVCMSKRRMVSLGFWLYICVYVTKYQKRHREFLCFFLILLCF